MSDAILVKSDGPVTTVTLNRPGQRNAITFDMWNELGDIATRLAGDHSVRCIVFRGAGDQAFSSGADIKDFPAHRYNPESAERYAQAFEGAMDRVERLPQPTITMISGACVGGGLEFATCTDIRIAAEGSRFGVPASRIGIVIGFKEARRLVSAVGAGPAAYLLMSGRLVGHEEALRYGLVASVVPPARLEAEVYALAADITKGAPVSNQDHKAIIHRVIEDPSLKSLTLADRDLQFHAFETADFLEGLKAFLEKRPPKFTGH